MSDKIDYATYTYQEQRIGTWVNGKPIYRALIYGAQLHSGGTDVLLGTLSNFSTVLQMYAWAKVSGYWTPLNMSYSTNISSIIQVKENGQVRAYYDSTYFAGSPFNVYVEYVKSS